MNKTDIEQVIKISVNDNRINYIPLTICSSFYVKEFRLLKFYIDNQRVWGLHEGTNNILFSNLTELFVDKKDYIKNSIVFTTIYECLDFLESEEYPPSLINSVKTYVNKCVNLDYIV